MSFMPDCFYFVVAWFGLVWTYFHPFVKEMNLCGELDCLTVAMHGTSNSNSNSGNLSFSAAAAKSLQSCPTLCDPIDGSHQAPQSLGFSRQEHWSGLPFPSPMHESEKWKWSDLVVSDSSWPHGLQPTRLLCPCDFPGKSTGIASLSLTLFNYKVRKIADSENLYYSPARSYGNSLFKGPVYFLPSFLSFLSFSSLHPPSLHSPDSFFLSFFFLSPKNFIIFKLD